MRFDLTDLQLFLSVVEQGSLTRGARATALSLASASERISGMEAVLGAKLLERTHRGVTPTPAGEVLFRHARSISLQIEQMRGELRAYGSGFRGRVKVLCNTAALIGFLPARLCQFLMAHPRLSVDLEERTSVEIALAIVERRADLGIAADIADLTALETRSLVTDRLVVLVGAGHRIARRASVSFSDIVSEPFVGLTDAALETHLAERASRLGIQLSYRARFRRIQDVAMLVRAGVGIAIQSESSLEKIRPDEMVRIPLADAWANRHLFLCASDFDLLTPHAKLLAQHLSSQ